MKLVEFWNKRLNLIFIGVLGFLPIINVLMLICYHLNFMDYSYLTKQGHLCYRLTSLYFIIDMYCFPKSKYALKNQNETKEIINHHLYSFVLSICGDILLFDIWGKSNSKTLVFMYAVNMSLESTNFIVKVHGKKLREDKLFSKLCVKVRLASVLYVFLHISYMVIYDFVNANKLASAVWMIANVAQLLLLKFQIVFMHDLWKRIGLLHPEA